MRINVYTEELPTKDTGTPLCEVVTADYVSSRTGQKMTNYGLRIYLKSHPDLHFIPGRDDDRSAVTFWCGASFKNVLGLVDMLKGSAEVYNLEKFRKTVAEDCAEAERQVGKHPALAAPYVSPPDTTGHKPIDFVDDGGTGRAPNPTDMFNATPASRVMG